LIEFFHAPGSKDRLSWWSPPPHRPRDRTEEELRTAGKSRSRVAARSGMSNWAVRELGVSGTEVARWLGVTQPAVSQAVKRREDHRGETSQTQRGIESYIFMDVPLSYRSDADRGED
jgi:hypothetical protein